MCALPTMFPRLKTGKATAAGNFHTGAHFETESKFAEFSGFLVSGRANQYSTENPSLFRRLILNGRCSGHWRCPFSVP
jgi:hypothetical protein